MDVKKNILFSLFILSNLQLILSLLFKRATLGQVWYFINSNSLVGVQKLVETNANFFNNFFFIFLNCNMFIISSIIFDEKENIYLNLKIYEAKRGSLILNKKISLKNTNDLKDFVNKFTKDITKEK